MDSKKDVVDYCFKGKKQTTYSKEVKCFYIEHTCITDPCCMFST